jgi:hypothetical protein
MPAASLVFRTGDAATVLTMAKTPEEMTAAMIQNLAEKTGKSLEQWLAIAKQSKLQKHGEIVKLLKSEHQLGHGYANLVAAKLLEQGAEPAGGDDLVAAQYAGAKAHLRPIYDALISAITGFGQDVELAPKKAYVSLRRSKQFGLIQPSTKDRVDVGINLKGQAPTARLEASGSFNAMVSHRVRVASAKEIDQELIGWLRQAYAAS